MIDYGFELWSKEHFFFALKYGLGLSAVVIGGYGIIQLVLYATKKIPSLKKYSEGVEDHSKKYWRGIEIVAIFYLSVFKVLIEPVARLFRKNKDEK